MALNTPAPILTDDHIDLIVTAAARWHVLASRTTAAFAGAGLERHVLHATEDQAGRALRAANTAAVRRLAQQGKSRMMDRTPGADHYHHRRVEGTLDPVEVIKAVHAAQEMCSSTPGWADSIAQRLLSAVNLAAEHRLPGYASAPWKWTRPTDLNTAPLGIAAAGEEHPDLPGLEWTDPNNVSEDRWAHASLVIVRPGAASAIPANLKARTGVVVMITETERHGDAWEAVTALAMPASQVWLWPICRGWLESHLNTHRAITDPVAGV